MSRTDSFLIWFDPAKGGIRLAKPYNATRHQDLRQTVTLCNGAVKLIQYEDGEFEAMEIFSAGAGLEIEVWPQRAKRP